MILKHLILGFTFGISMSIISWMVGMIINGILIKTIYYDKLSNLNFIRNKALNKKIGMKPFKWIVKNTFFKFFNQKIKLEKQNDDLNEIRKEMTFSEISHLIGFTFVTIFSIYKSFSTGMLFGMIMMVPNTFMNLYPSLLQQQNKRRIDLVLKRKTVSNS